MIIDSHTHLSSKSGALGKAGPDDLLRSMDKAGIDKALVFAGWSLNGITNEVVVQAAEQHPDRLYAVVSVQFDEKKYKAVPYSDEESDYRRELDKAVLAVQNLFLDNKSVGLKMYPGYEHWYPGDEGLKNLFSVCAEQGKPVIFHSGDTFDCKHHTRHTVEASDSIKLMKRSKLKYSQPIHIDDLASDLPALKIVVAHLGYPWERDAGELVYKNENVYADCSGFVYGTFSPGDQERFQKMWRNFVSVAGNSDKILFGTDWPVSDQESYIETVSFMRGPRDRPQTEASCNFYGRTAARLFGI